MKVRVRRKKNGFRRFKKGVAATAGGGLAFVGTEIALVSPSAVQKVGGLTLAGLGTGLAVGGSFEALKGVGEKKPRRRMRRMRRRPRRRVRVRVKKIK